MSASWLGRGRGSRLAVYGACSVLLLIILFLYRAFTWEISRLKELHNQCVHQQEALAAQLQVIFEYKVRLERSLAEEKSSNAAIKQELQQRASREKSLRDKSSLEANQRFDSLQQMYKILQGEHQDLQEECKKRQKQALDDTTTLEETLQELRGRLKQADEDKDNSLEHLKTKYLELEIEKDKLENMYNDVLKNNGHTNGTIDHLKKEVSQLTRELTEAQKQPKNLMIDPIAVSLPSASQKPISQPDESVNKSGFGTLVQPDAIIDHVPLQSQQNSLSSSSTKGMPAPMKSEISTKTNTVLASTVADNKAKSMTKVKLPLGVVPIPVMLDSNIHDRKQASPKETKDALLPMKKSIRVDSKEKKNLESINLDAPPVDMAIKDDHDTPFRVRPGIQEIGDEPNHIGRIPGVDDTGGQNGNDADQDQYDNEIYKGHPQKNDFHLEGEEEPEDEDDQLDYINDAKADKQN